MTAENEARGRSNRQRGNNAELDFLKRDILPLFPNADHITGSGRGDYTGINDLVLEHTVVPWSSVGPKLRQAQRDSLNMRTDDGQAWRFAVAKRINPVERSDRRRESAYGAPGERIILEPAGSWLRHWARECSLARSVVRADHAYDDGYSDGIEEGRQQVLRELAAAAQAREAAG